MGLLEKAEIHNQHPPRRQKNLDRVYRNHKRSSFLSAITNISFAEKYHIDAKQVFCLCLALIISYFQLFNFSLLDVFPHLRNLSISSSISKNQNGMGMPLITEEQLAAESNLSVDLDEMIVGLPEPEAYSKAEIVNYISYKIEAGDIIGEISRNFGLNQDTLLSTNNIRNSRLIQIGQVLKIPNQDGIMYTVKAGDTLSSIAEEYESDVSAIQTVNELFSDTVHPNSKLFLPGAQMNTVEVQEINGDLFIWPITGYITSLYGSRPSPFTGVRQFHTGLDIGSPTGTPIKAAMSGRVTAAGYDDISGNHVVITHHSGYRTLYAHMSVIRAKAGSYVRTGDRIGDVGSTGLSTGPHLHFTVYKNGVTVNPRQLMK
jgi:murein DD-endopeptidase MepM/ murein hydrolase activator NlpD